MKQKDRIRDEDNLTILVGGSKTNQTKENKENGRLEQHCKPTNTIRYPGNTQQYWLPN